MTRPRKAILLVAAPLIAAGASVIEYGTHGDRRIIDPYKPQTRRRLRAESPAKRLIAAANHQRAKGI